MSREVHVRLSTALYKHIRSPLPYISFIHPRKGWFRITLEEIAKQINQSEHLDAGSQVPRKSFHAPGAISILDVARAVKRFLSD